MQIFQFRNLKKELIVLIKKSIIYWSNLEIKY